MKHLPLPPQLFMENRKRFVKQMKPNSIAIFNSNDEVPSNGDALYRFQQNSDLYWLCGIEQEDTMVIMFPGSQDEKYREVLVLVRPVELKEKWDGKRLRANEATELCGIKTIVWLDSLDALLQTWIHLADTIYLNTNENDRKASPVQTRDYRYVQQMKERYPLHNFERSAKIMKSLRAIKTKYEVAVTQLSTLRKTNLLDAYKQKLIQVWSVKDYNGVSYPSDKLFFETFPLFGVASSKTIDTGLVELKNRAKAEHVNYIETMTGVFGDDAIKLPGTWFDNSLAAAQSMRDTALTFRILDTLYNAMIAATKPVAIANDKYISDTHRRLGLDDNDFTLRYQLAFIRVINPTLVFRKMLLAFEATANDTSKLIGGVNILAPENNDISMRDYWLHMQMFKYCRNKPDYKKVKCSLHAGELVLGMVKPEELTWHIYDAIHVANADRIGHGVDIPYEHDCYDLLKFMAANKRAIEINLYSNQFILKVQDDRHPITLYKQFKVPIVISTDDAGVLRSNLIEQYVLLANRYKNITYRDIKQFVYNSIEYSFIPDAKLKARIRTQLDEQFNAFEKKILSIAK